MAESGSDFAAIERRFTAHMRDPARHTPPDDVEDRRVAIYRGLLYRNVEGFMANAFPVLRSLLDDTRWHALIRDYFARHRARTPLFPKMPQEFLHYLEQAREQADDPPFMRELAYYEWLEAEILSSPRELDEVEVASVTDFEHGRPIPNPVMQPCAFAWPVHRIGPAYQPHTAPEQPTYLVVFRHRDDRVGFMELNAVSARLLQLVMDNHDAPADALLVRIARELEHPDEARVLATGRDILRTFLAHEIVLGTVPVPR